MCKYNKNLDDLELWNTVEDRRLLLCILNINNFRFLVMFYNLKLFGFFYLNEILYDII